MRWCRTGAGQLDQFRRRRTHHWKLSSRRPEVLAVASLGRAERRQTLSGLFYLWVCMESTRSSKPSPPARTSSFHTFASCSWPIVGSQVRSACRAGSSHHFRHHSIHFTPWLECIRPIGLTPQSRGRLAASRKPPLTSNVSPLPRSPREVVVQQVFLASAPVLKSNTCAFQRRPQQALPAASTATTAELVPSFAPQQACAAGPSKSGLPHTPAAQCLLRRPTLRQALQFKPLRGCRCFAKPGQERCWFQVLRGFAPGRRQGAFSFVAARRAFSPAEVKHTAGEARRNTLAAGRSARFANAEG
jgi:hypothetical protein